MPQVMKISTDEEESTDDIVDEEDYDANVGVNANVGNSNDEVENQYAAGDVHLSEDEDLMENDAADGLISEDYDEYQKAVPPSGLDELIGEIIAGLDSVNPNIVGAESGEEEHKLSTELVPTEKGGGSCDDHTASLHEEQYVHHPPSTVSPAPYHRAKKTPTLIEKNHTQPEMGQNVHYCSCPANGTSQEQPTRIEIVDDDLQTQDHRNEPNLAEGYDAPVHAHVSDEDIAHLSEDLECSNSWTQEVEDNVVSTSEDVDSEDPTFIMDDEAAADKDTENTRSEDNISSSGNVGLQTRSQAILFYARVGVE